MTQNELSLTTAHISIAAPQSKPISPDLWGIFFEDLNYAADGGLYAELIQNRSFAYTSDSRSDWNFLTAWELLPQARMYSFALGTQDPIHPNNPHYLVLNLDGEIELRNTGFDGIALKAGHKYDVSLFSRALGGKIEALEVRLESRSGQVLGAVTLDAPSVDWTKISASIESSHDERHGRFVLKVAGEGSVALDVISLFPQKTFCNRANGLRADLAQVVADLKPRFMRFPGGCLVHGDGLDNLYHWKDTIGPVEERREQRNIWNYHQSLGLGYFEYFQFCEDIGAKPIPVVPAGVCCQNSGGRWTGVNGCGQEGLPLEAMPAFIQDILDLIEWANGPADSVWGAKRAAQGHPESFGLEYLGVGNEDHITPVFRERFEMIERAVRAKHPEIAIIGTTGPFHSGPDYDEGWNVARELKLAIVDEHFYENPDWFWANMNRYDAYSRDDAAVYLGEYAAHDAGRKNTLRSALAEGAFMTSLERNGDIVRLASYAPLLAKHDFTQWAPDLIYFNNQKVFPSVNYLVQRLFMHNTGDSCWPIEMEIESEAPILAASCVHDSQSGDTILKIVSRSETSIHTNISGLSETTCEATCTVLAGDPLAENAFGATPMVVPRTCTLEVGKCLSYEVPPHSLSVFRVSTSKPQ